MEADDYKIIPRLSSYTDLCKNKREDSFPKRSSLIEIVSSRENELTSLQHDVITFHNNIKKEKESYFCCCFKSNKVL
jgi:hypothetical protein